MTLKFNTVYALCGSLNLMLAMMVVVFNFRMRDAMYFFFFVMIQVFWIGALYCGYYFLGEVWRPDLSVVFIRLAYSFGLLMVVFLSFFFIYFPRRELVVRPILKVGMLVSGLLMAFLAAGTDLVHSAQVFVEGRYVADEFGVLYVPYLVLVSVMFGLGFYFSYAKLRLVEGVRRRKVFLAAVFAWIFLGLAFVANILLPFFNVYLPISWLTVLFSLVFVVPTFFAYRYCRFFKVSYFVYRFVGVFFLVILFCCGMVLFEGKAVLAGIWGLLVAVFGRWSWSFFESRDFRFLKEVVLDLKLKILFAEDFEVLVSRLEDSLGQVLGYGEVKLFLSSRGEVDRRFKSFGSQALIYDEIPFRDFSKGQRFFLGRELKRLRGQFCLPLVVNDEVLGLFVLGNNLDGRTFGVEEVSQFEELGKVLALTVANILVRSGEMSSKNFLSVILRRQTKELRGLISRQSDFFATTAHEFRTPLNIAIFQLEDAMSSHCDQEELMEDMKSLAGSLAILKDLTQRLFDFQRYDFDKVVLRMEEVDLGSFFGRVCAEFEALMLKRGKVFVFRNLLEGACLRKLDVGQMRQVVSNLLSNAMKFAERIEVVLGFVDGEVCLKVIDDGCGVADGLKERIFEKFQSGSGKLPDSYGLGMGLFIAKKIVLMHGGRIVVEDSPGGGATFVVYL